MDTAQPEDFPPDVAAQRRDEVLRRMLNTAPKPHAEVKRPLHRKVESTGGDQAPPKNGADEAP